MTKEVLPYAKDFVPALESYCEAIANNQHYDQRPHLFVNFLRLGFGIEAEEIELEHKIKASQVRGRIDAFFRHLIIEFKSDLERERAAAQAELKKYFEAQAHPLDYVALVPVIQDSALAAKYLANWQIHAKHSEAYLGQKPQKTGLSV